MFEHQNMFEYGGVEKTLESLRQEYLCPISREIMKNPVVDYEGISYQKEHIQKWYQHNDISPVTNVHVLSKTLFPNYYLQDLINKVEAQLPALCSFIQILKNEILQLRVQNEILRKEVEFDAMSNDEGKPNHNTNAFEGFSKEQKSEKMIMLQYKEKKENQRQLNAQKCEKMSINMRENTFQFIKSLNRQNIMENNTNMLPISERGEYQEQIQKQQKQGIKSCMLSKRKMIKKKKIQQCFDLSMENLLKKSKKDWVHHLDNINVEYSQAVSKQTQELQLKEQSIKRYNETIKTQEVQIIELNKMMQESQFPEKKILDKLQDLSAQFKTLLESKPLAKKDPKDNVEEQLRQLRDQNEIMRNKLGVYQNERDNKNEVNDNNTKSTQANIESQVTGLNRNMRLSQKYKLQLEQLQSQFYGYKLRKTYYMQKQTSKHKSSYSKLQNKLLQSTSQFKKLQKLLTQQNQKHKKTIHSLSALNQQLTIKLKDSTSKIQNILNQSNQNNIKPDPNEKYQKVIAKLQSKNQKLINKLKNTTQTHKIKLKQLKQNNKVNKSLNEADFIKQLGLQPIQLSQLQNEKTQLLKLLEQSHQTYQRTSYQFTVQINEYKEKIKSLSEFMAVRHQMWMFIFFNIFGSLDYCAKEDSEKEDQSDFSRKAAEKSEIQHFKSENNKDVLLPVRIELSQMIPENGTQLPKLAQQNLIQPSIIKIDNNDQANTNNRQQNQSKINEMLERKHKIKIPKYPQAVYQIKSTLNLYMWNLQINLKKNIKTHGKIYRNSPTQTLEFYQKLKIIYQALYDKTAWNFWNAYKINLDEITFKQIGFEMNVVILLKVINSEYKNTDWKEVIAISSQKQPIYTMQWKILVKYNYLYPNLTVLDLKNSKIEEVTLRQLQSWKKLKSIDLSENPLSQTSISHLERYAKKHPTVIMKFNGSSVCQTQKVQL